MSNEQPPSSLKKSDDDVSSEMKSPQLDDEEECIDIRVKVRTLNQNHIQYNCDLWYSLSNDLFILTELRVIKDKK